MPHASHFVAVPTVVADHLRALVRDVRGDGGHLVPAGVERGGRPNRDDSLLDAAPPMRLQGSVEAKLTGL